MANPLSTFVSAVFRGIGQEASKDISDIDKALDDLCRPPVDPYTRKLQSISDENIANISRVLKSYETARNVQAWHYLPRTFAVLRQIRCSNLLGNFLERGLTDSCIPYVEDDLPISSQLSRQAFVRSQHSVLTNAKDLERGIEGRHRYFPTTGDNHFWVLGHLGSGGSGDVQEVMSRLSRKIYARKKFRRTGNNQREWVQKHKHFDQEITALKRLNHHHLVQIVGSYTDRNFLAFLMTPVANSNLLSYLRTSGRSQDQPTLRSFFGCLASTVAYLHSQRVYHMDLKPENILISNGDLFVADFGSAHDWLKQEQSTAYSVAPRTFRYQPPELDKNPFAPRNWATDMWSLGVVFLEMTTVLRGKTVQAFRDHLSPPEAENRGTGRMYVYNNPAATASWMEILRSSEGPDYDNEPLMWVYSMIRPTPSDRPKANRVLDMVLESSAGELFRRSCCAERWQDTPRMPPDLDYTEQMGPQYSNQDNEFSIEELLRANPVHNSVQPQEFSGGRSIEDWIDTQTTPGTWPTDAEGGSPLHDDDLPFELSHDPAGVTDGAPQPSSIPQRLQDIGLFDPSPTTPGAWDHESDTSDDTLGFELTEDEAYSEASEDTVKALNCQTPDSDGPQASSNPPVPEVPVSAPQTLGKGTGSHQGQIQTKPTQQQAPKVAKSGPACAVDKSSTTIGHRLLKSSKPQQGSVAELPSQEPSKSTSHGRVSKAKARNPNAKQVPRKKSEPLSAANLRQLNAKELTAPSASKVEHERKFVLLSENTKSPPIFNGRLFPVPASERERVKREAMFSAERYINDIWVAESSAATSVLSENTRQKLEGGGMSVTKWQDKTYNYLGKFCKEGKAAAVRCLLDQGVNPGTKQKPRPGPLIFAARGASQRHVKCARVLLEKGADPNVRQSGTRKTPLHFAIENEQYKGYGNLIFELLQNGANPNIADASKEYPIHKILHGFDPLPKHRRDALALLLYFGADVSVIPQGTQNGPLHMAVSRKDPWAVGMLLEKGASVDTLNGAGVTPLGLAVAAWSPQMTKDQAEVALQLLDKGAAVEQTVGSSEGTALHYAIRHGRFDLVQALLQSHGADTNAIDKHKQRPFDVARRAMEIGSHSAEQHGKIMRLLFEADGMPLPATEGTCAVVHAVQKPDEALLSMLIERGAPVNLAYNGKLLLNVACGLQHEEIIRRLTMAGAYKDVQDSEGKTALDIAKDVRNGKILKFLRKDGKCQGEATAVT